MRYWDGLDDDLAVDCLWEPIHEDPVGTAQLVHDMRRALLPFAHLPTVAKVLEHRLLDIYEDDYNDRAAAGEL